MGRLTLLVSPPKNFCVVCRRNCAPDDWDVCDSCRRHVACSHCGKLGIMPRSDFCSLRCEDLYYAAYPKEKTND